MKLFRYLFILTAFLGLAVVASADQTSTYFGASGRVQVSSVTVTQIMAADVNAKRTIICNNNQTSGQDIILMDNLSVYSTSASTGSFRLLATGCMSPDSPLAPYKGPVYGLSIGTITLTVDKLRVD